MTRQPDQGWREWMLNSLPKMEATTEQATGFQPATPGDFGPITFRSDRSPDDPTALLDGLPLAKWTAIRQRAADLHAQIPRFEAIREVSLEKISHVNRISELMKPRGDGGPNLPESAPQVQSERRLLERAEQEFARLQALQEIRTAKWSAAGQLERSITDWLLRGGVPHGCVIESIDDLPLSELLVKADAGRIEAAVERFRHRRRELLADAHRVNSSPWGSSEQKRKAAEFINQLAERGRPNFESMVEHNAAFSFPTTMLQSFVRGIETPALAFANDVPDVLAIMCWVLRDQLLTISNSELDEVADDKVAMDQKQRDIALAQINADMVAIERFECAAIWASETRGEILDFRNDTTPMCAIGVRLVTVPQVQPPGTSAVHAFDIVGGARR